VPLVVKLAAVNKMMSAARRMRRVVLGRKSLFGAVACLSGLVVFFLLVWSIVDIPRKKAEYHLVKDQPDDAERTLVVYNYYCSSRGMVWPYIAVAWQTVLLIIASVSYVRNYCFKCFRCGACSEPDIQR
jgi:hypothetical protein